jgi:hypothetical protein
MAPVLAQLVRLLAVLSFTAALAIIAFSGVWAMLAFTSVREHGLVAVTDPEKVIEAEMAKQGGKSAPTVSGVGPAANAAAKSSAAHPASEATAASAAPEATKDQGLRWTAGAATIFGIGALALLPVLLFVAFVTALVRCPRAAGASMGGLLWSIGLLASVLPWSSFWPQVPWTGIFVPYDALVADVAASAANGPFAIGVLFTHVGVPILAVAILIGIVWRCGEPLHAELLAAEALFVDPTVDRDAAKAAARGAFVPGGRTAASLAGVTGNPLPSVGATSDAAHDHAVSAGHRQEHEHHHAAGTGSPDEDRPRRLI